MGINDRNFNIMRVHWKIQVLGGGGAHKKTYIYRWDCLKKGGGAWTVCRFKRGLGKRRGGVETPMHGILCKWNFKCPLNPLHIDF